MIKYKLDVQEELKKKGYTSYIIRKNKTYFYIFNNNRKCRRTTWRIKKGGRELCGLPAKKYEKEKDCLAFAIYS